jgi:hypothetical protein
LSRGIRKAKRERESFDETDDLEKRQTELKLTRKGPGGTGAR